MLPQTEVLPGPPAKAATKVGFAAKYELKEIIGNLRTVLSLLIILINFHVQVLAVPLLVIDVSEDLMG